MNVSIVMPNHNRVEALPLTLESLCRQTYPAEQFEVIVVDQVSTDGSRELVAGFTAPYSLRLVTQDAKYGISVGRNGGVEAAKGALIILLDADIIAEPGLVKAHADLHVKYSNPILGCGRLLPYPPAYKTFIEQVANPDAGLERELDLEDYPPYYAFGGHLSFKVSTFQEVGPFNPELKGAEDTDFAYRAMQMGIGIKNCSEAVGYHNHSRSLEERRQRSSQYWSMIPAFLTMHPELRGTIPGITELEPIFWGHESGVSFRSKLKAAFWSLHLVRLGLYRYLSWAEKKRALPRWTKFCYYRLMLGDMRAGARRGQR
jgi:GT2 family glycosyltransferase